MTDEELDQLEKTIIFVLANGRSILAQIAELHRLRAENAALLQQVAGHCERIAAQSELPSRKDEQ